jgi:hypothetical protein
MPESVVPIGVVSVALVLVPNPAAALAALLVAVPSLPAADLVVAGTRCPPSRRSATRTVETVRAALRLQVGCGSITWQGRLHGYVGPCNRYRGRRVPRPKHRTRCTDQELESSRATDDHPSCAYTHSDCRTMGKCHRRFLSAPVHRRLLLVAQCAPREAQVFEPQSFAAYVASDILRLRFPLVLYNSGAKPIIIQNLRLRFPEEPRWNRPLPWTTTRSQLKPASDDNHAFPAVLSLSGRTAQQMFVEFGGVFPEVTPLARDYRVQIEVNLGHRKHWKPLTTFTLSGAHITAPERYIAYSNSPHDLTQDTIKESEAALERVTKRL